MGAIGCIGIDRFHISGQRGSGDGMTKCTLLLYFLPTLTPLATQYPWDSHHYGRKEVPLV